MDDLGSYFTPHFQYINNEFKAGRIPTWFSLYNYGRPELFKLDFGLFNPITALYLITNYILNINQSILFTHELREYFIIFLLISSGFSFFYYTKKTFNIEGGSSLGILIASLAYTLNSFIFDMSTLINGTIFIVIPPLIYQTIKIAKNKEVSTKSLAYFVFLNYLVFSLGYPSYFLYLFVFQLSLVLYFNYKSIWKFIILYILSLGISMYFLLPYFNIIGDSNRSDLQGDHKVFAIPPYKYFELLNPELGIEKIFKLKNFFIEPIFSFGGIFFPILLIGAHYILKEKKDLWILYIVFFFFIYSTGDHFGYIELVSRYFPPVKFIRSHYQSAIALNYLFCILIYFGLTRMFDYKKLLKTITILTLFICFGFIIYVLLSSKVSDSGSQFTNWMFISIQLISLLLIATYSNKLSYTNTIIILFFLILTNSPIMSNKVSSKYTAESFFGRSDLIENIPIDNKYTVYFINSQYTANASFHNIPTFHGYDNLTPKTIIKIDKQNYRNLGVNYIVSDTKLSGPGYSLYKSVKNDGHVYFGYLNPEEYTIYKVDNPLPKYFSPKNLDVCKSSNCTSEKDSREKVSYNGNEILKNESKNYSIEILKDEGNLIELKVSSDSQRFIASRDNMTKGWSITINGTEGKLYSVDEGFKGFFVNQGESTIIMKYFPPYLIEGAIASLFSLGILIIYILKKSSQKSDTSKQ